MKRGFPLLAILVLVTGLPIVAGVQHPTARPVNIPAESAADPMTEEGLRVLLDASGARFRESGERLGRAVWARLTGSAPVEPDAEAKAREDLAATFSDPHLQTVLKEWLRRRTVTEDPMLSRRVNRWSHVSPAAAIELDPEIYALRERLAETMATHRPMLDGTPVETRDLEAVLETSPDRDRRRAAWLALQSTGQLVRDDVVRLVRERALRTLDLGARYLQDVYYGANELERLWIFKMSSVVARTTQDDYDQLLSSLTTAAGVEHLQAWDIEYALHTMASERGAAAIASRHFPADRALAIAGGLVRALGFAPPHVTSAAGSIPTDTRGFPLVLPNDYRLVTRADPGSPVEAGPEGVEALLRQYAHALQARHGGVEAPLLSGYAWVPGSRNGFYAEGMAETMARFLRDPVYLESRLEIDAGAVPILLDDMRRRRLLRLRRVLLGLSMEYVLYTNPDADLDDRFRKLHARYLGVEIDPTLPAPWPSDPRYVTRPTGYGEDLVAFSIADDLFAHLRDELGEGWLEEGRAAAWLIENCYVEAEVKPLQFKLSDLEVSFNFKRFMKDLEPDTDSK